MDFKQLELNIAASFLRTNAVSDLAAKELAALAVTHMANTYYKHTSLDETKKGQEETKKPFRPQSTRGSAPQNPATLGDEA